MLSAKASIASLLKDSLPESSLPENAQREDARAEANSTLDAAQRKRRGNSDKHNSDKHNFSKHKSDTVFEASQNIYRETSVDGWLCAHFPRLALEAALRGVQENGQPLDNNRPVVVLEDNRIIQRNNAACQAGIAVGSSLATANSIAEGVQGVNRDSDNEQRYLRYLANVAYQFSALVSLQPPSSVLLEVRRSRRLFEGIQNIAEPLNERYRKLGHFSQISAAQTPLAALALAKSGAALPWQAGSDKEHSPGTHKETRKKAREKTHKRTQDEILSDVPIGCLELSAAEIEHFANMGLRRLGQLLKLPRSELAVRSADRLVDYLLRLSGQRPDPRQAIAPIARFRSTLNLLDAVSSKAGLEQPMQRLAAELHQWLKRHQYGVLHVRWHFSGQSRELTGNAGHKDLPTQAQLNVRFSRSEQSELRLLLISHLKLEQLELPTDVLTITLQVIQWEPWATGSAPGRGLFTELAQGGNLPSELIDQLTARLGEEALRTIASHNDYRPEFAWTQQTALQSATKSNRTNSPERLTKNSPERLANNSPERLTRNSPERLTRNSPERLNRNSPERLTRNSPEEPRGNRPLWLFQQARPINRDSFHPLSGPERIETGWWQHGTCRDYYIARTRDGANIWVYLDASGEWFLHGYFA